MIAALAAVVLAVAHPVVPHFQHAIVVVFENHERGDVTERANPNGAVNGIAGICNEARNVVGLMPHPERACEGALGSADGLILFESAVAAMAQEGVMRTA